LDWLIKLIGLNHSLNQSFTNSLIEKENPKDEAIDVGLTSKAGAL
jgi:hypothetical protein